MSDNIVYAVFGNGSFGPHYTEWAEKESATHVVMSIDKFRELERENAERVKAHNEIFDAFHKCQQERDEALERIRTLEQPTMYWPGDGESMSLETEEEVAERIADDIGRGENVIEQVLCAHHLPVRYMHVRDVSEGNEWKYDWKWVNKEDYEGA